MFFFGTFTDFVEAAQNVESTPQKTILGLFLGTSADWFEAASRECFRTFLGFVRLP